jgi:hypothetical protein
MLKQSLVEQRIMDLEQQQQSSKQQLHPQQQQQQQQNQNKLSNLPHWPHKPIDNNTKTILKTTLITKNSISNNKMTLFSIQNDPIISNSNNNNESPTTTTTIAFDGDETLTSFRTNKTALNSNNDSNTNNNSHPFTSTSFKNIKQGSNSGLRGRSSHQEQQDEGGEEGEENSSSTLDQTDLMKLRYLEKSIKFIQQQRNETLESLHNEIEKLKIENRDLHFKLALGNNSDNKNDDRPPSTSAKINKIINNSINQEADINKRLDTIKINYETTKIKDLQLQLDDTIQKNDYLTKIIQQLEKKRSANSAYISTTNPQQSTIITKLNLNNIYSVHPTLLIKINKEDEPRAAKVEEAEVLVKKLFELYKQQKQQITNMNSVLKEMMLNNNNNNTNQDINQGQYNFDSYNFNQRSHQLSQFILGNNGNSKIKNL